MPLHRPAGFIRPGFDPLKNPDAPTSVSASGGDASASVSFTAPSNVGGSAITAYYAVSNPDGITGTAASSPVSVTGLTNGTAYTFNVWALNTYGPGVWSAASGSVTPAAARAVFMGGYAATFSNVIDYVQVSTTGNATSFGSLFQAQCYSAGSASSTLAVDSGGLKTGGTYTSAASYITIATTGDSTNFGNLSSARSGVGGCGNSTYALAAGGFSNPTYYATIDRMTYASLGSATNYGSLSVNRYWPAAASSPTRAVFMWGSNGTTVIDYIAIASGGTATDWGTSANAHAQGGSAFGSSTVGVFNWYSENSTSLTYATTGVKNDFGSSSSTGIGLGSASSNTRGLIAGGDTQLTNIRYTAIGTTGSFAAFGSLTVGRSTTGACNANGGVQ